MSLMPDERPSPQQMQIAADWLRKNDIDDPQGRACQKTADYLEDRIKSAKGKVERGGR